MYSEAKLFTCVRYIDGELERLQSRVWPGVDVYTLWGKATPEALAELEEISAISSASKLADAFDYCAEHYSTWEDKNPPPVDTYSDEYEYNGRYSDIFEKRAGDPTERMERAKSLRKAEEIFESLGDADRDAIWSDEADLSDLDIHASPKVRKLVNEMIQSWVEDPGQHK